MTTHETDRPDQPTGPVETDEIDEIDEPDEAFDTTDEIVEASDPEDEATDDESVLLTESEPGSVLPPEEVEELEEEEDVEDAPGPDPMAVLAPAAPGAPVDPGTGTYAERWSAIQVGFLDEPRRAVQSAGALVDEMWSEIAQSMAGVRDELDGRGSAAESSTEDLRLTLQRYRDLYTQLTEFSSSVAP